MTFLDTSPEVAKYLPILRLLAGIMVLPLPFPSHSLQAALTSRLCWSTTAQDVPEETGIHFPATRAVLQVNGSG